MVKVGKVERPDVVTAVVVVEADNPADLDSLDTQHKALQAVMAAGIVNPILEWSAAGFHFDKVSGHFSKVYRFGVA